jgi:hypothetical protein
MKTTPAFAGLMLAATAFAAGAQQGTGAPATAPAAQAQQGTAAPARQQGSTGSQDRSASPTQRQQEPTGSATERQQDRTNADTGSSLPEAGRNDAAGNDTGSGGSMSAPAPIAFEATDGNNDGYITPDELPVDHALRAGFDDADRSGDGRLTQEELDDQQ